MKLYIMCPICGTRIGKAQETKELECTADAARIC